MQPSHVRFGRRLVDEDKPGWVEPALAAFPLFPGFGDVRPVLFGRVERLFLYVSPILVSTQWIAPIVQLSSSLCLISSSVRSGSLAINSFISCPRSGINRAFLPENRCLGLRSPVFAFCPSSFFTIPTDTLKRFATSSLVPSFAS